MITNSPFVGHFSPLHNAIVAARAAAAGAPPAYQIDNAAIFDSADSSYLYRTPSSVGNRKILTISRWFKRSEIGTRQVLLSASDVSGNGHAIELYSSDFINIYNTVAGSAVGIITDALFRDVAAFYHLCIQIDTTQAAAADRCTVEVNGLVQPLTTTTAFTLNADLAFNDTVEHNINRRSSTATFHCDLIDAENVIIDGSALDATNFGEFDSNGVWQPIAYTGSYSGTNSCYLDYADDTHFGNDVSGNNNDWTDSGFATDHQVADTPTNNYCTLSAIDSHQATLSNGGLTNLTPVALYGPVRGSFGVSSGKWYWEVTVDSVGLTSIGIAQDSWLVTTGTNAVGYGTGRSIGYSSGGNVVDEGSTVATYATYTTGDVIGIEVNMDGGEITFYKNGTVQGTPVSDLTGTILPAVSDSSGSSSTTVTANFGQRSFSHTPSTGYETLCTDNLPVPDILKGSDYFNTIIYDDGAGAKTGVGHQPDLVWCKSRGSAYEHELTDSVRGVTKALSCDSTNVESTDSTGLTSLDSDGFTVGADTNYSDTTGDGMVAWCWKKGAIPGFDIVPFVGTGVAHAENHSLGVVPDMMVVKNRNSPVKSYIVYHSANTAAPETDYLTLDIGAATIDLDTVWNDTAPTDTQFTLGTSVAVNEDTKDHIAYLFASVEGFSKFGSYIGNGSIDGPFIWCGFSPRFLMIHRTDGAFNWVIWDTARSTFNEASHNLFPDLPDAEYAAAGTEIDLVSNGFKLRTTSANRNGSGGPYIFMAFAEHPFKNARAR